MAGCSQTSGTARRPSHSEPILPSIECDDDIILTRVVPKISVVHPEEQLAARKRRDATLLTKEKRLRASDSADQCARRSVAHWTVDGLSAVRQSARSGDVVSICAQLNVALRVNRNPVAGVDVDSRRRPGPRRIDDEFAPRCSDAPGLVI